MCLFESQSKGRSGDKAATQRRAQTRDWSQNGSIWIQFEFNIFCFQLVLHSIHRYLKLDLSFPLTRKKADSLNQAILLFHYSREQRQPQRSSSSSWSSAFSCCISSLCALYSQQLIQEYASPGRHTTWWGSNNNDNYIEETFQKLTFSIFIPHSMSISSCSSFLIHRSNT